MPLLIPLAACMAPPTPANPRVLTRGTSRPSLAPDTKRLSRRRSRAEWSGRSAPYRNSEEAPRGVERRAERHAATRFAACAAELAARRGGCIQPTKHRDAKRREGDGSGGAGSGSEAETGRGRDEHPRCHGRQVSPPPAGHTEAGRGGLRRTATRRRICIRQAVAWTRRPPERHRAHGCGETCRALTDTEQARNKGKHHYTCKTEAQPMFITLRSTSKPENHETPPTRQTSNFPQPRR